MSWWKYKSLFELNWNEPIQFSKQRIIEHESRIKPWERPFTVLLFMAAPMVLLHIINGEVVFNSIFNIPSLALAGVLYAYWEYWFKSVVPGSVGFDTTQIVATSLVIGRKEFEFKNIEKIIFKRLEMNGISYRVMEINTKEDTTYTVGIPDNQDLEEITSYLEGCGINFEEQT